MTWQFNSTGAGFMVGSLAILIIVGVIFNNLTNTGFTNTNAYSPPNCVGTPNCSISGGVTTCTSLNCPAFSSVQGCTVQSQCQLGSTTFLNRQSPFTYLFEGNIIGFFISVFSTGEKNNTIYSGYTICIPQINGVYANQTANDITNFQCLSYTAVGAGSHPFPTVGVPLNATSTFGNASVWSITGCKLVNKNYPCQLNFGDGIEAWNGTNDVQGFNAIYVKNGTAISKTASCNIVNSLASCIQTFHYLFSTGVTSFTCPTTHLVNGININATTYYCLLPYQNQNTSTTNSNTINSLPNSFAGISWLFGAILLFLGFGFGVTTALIGFTLNAQGTRMCQVFGLGLFIFIPFFSEFGSWLFPAVISVFSPFAIFLIGGLFFFGLYSQTTAGGTAGS